MTDPSLREALLKHEGGTSVGTEIDVLQGLVTAEERRTRRLIVGTIAVCGLWAAMEFVLVVVSFATAVKAPELPAGAVPLPQPTVGGPQMLVSGVAGFLLVLVAFLCLPAVVMIPLLLLYLRRRFASMRQLRTSLAAIDAQLKLMAQTTQSPPIDPPS